MTERETRRLDSEMLVVLRRLVAASVWLVADDDGSPIVTTSPAGAPIALGFLERPYADALDRDTGTVVHTSLWAALRATPRGVGLVLQPGQEDELEILEADVDAVLGAPRETVAAIAPAELARIAVTKAAIVDNRIIPSPDGVFVGRLVDGLDELDESTMPDLAIGAAMPFRLDGPTAIALTAAATAFPVGFDIVIGTLQETQYPAVLAARDSLAEELGMSVDVLGVRVEQVSERIVYVVDHTEPAVVTRAAEVADVSVLPTFVVPRSDVPVVGRQLLTLDDSASGA